MVQFYLEVVQELIAFMELEGSLHVHKYSPLERITSYLNSNHTFTPHFSRICFNITLSH